MKILHFIGLCTFAANDEAVETNFGKGLWDKDLVVTTTEEVTEDSLPFPLPKPLEEMGKNMIAAVPNPPENGINEIKGWLIGEDVEEMKGVVDAFKGQFGQIHNKPIIQDPFLDFLKGMLDTLKGLREGLEQENPEQVDKPEEMTQDHESEG